MENKLTNGRDAGIQYYINRLQAVFAAMDREYNRVAALYGFECNGCGENCCQSLFYHHTHLECLYIKEGFKTLGAVKTEAIKSRAKDICRQSAAAGAKQRPPRIMCPLNFDGRCILYHYRPMICRLHGIPHELQKNGRNKIYGPGCATFDAMCADKAYFKFDRTFFYFELAGLENEFRKAAGVSGKIKLTIAEIIDSFS